MRSRVWHQRATSLLTHTIFMNLDASHPCTQLRHRLGSLTRTPPTSFVDLGSLTNAHRTFACHSMDCTMSGRNSRIDFLSQPAMRGKFLRPCPSPNSMGTDAACSRLTSVARAAFGCGPTANTLTRCPLIAKKIAKSHIHFSAPPGSSSVMTNRTESGRRDIDSKVGCISQSVR